MTTPRAAEELISISRASPRASSLRLDMADLQGVGPCRIGHFLHYSNKLSLIALGIEARKAAPFITLSFETVGPANDLVIESSNTSDAARGTEKLATELDPALPVETTFASADIYKATENPSPLTNAIATTSDVYRGINKAWQDEQAPSNCDNASTCDEARKASRPGNDQTMNELSNVQQAGHIFFCQENAIEMPDEATHARDHFYAADEHSPEGIAERRPRKAASLLAHPQTVAKAYQQLAKQLHLTKAREGSKIYSCTDGKHEEQIGERHERGQRERSGLEPDNAGQADSLSDGLEECEACEGINAAAAAGRRAKEGPSSLCNVRNKKSNLAKTPSTQEILDTLKDEALHDELATFEAEMTENLLPQPVSATPAEPCVEALEQTRTTAFRLEPEIYPRLHMPSCWIHQPPNRAEDMVYCSNAPSSLTPTPEDAAREGVGVLSNEGTPNAGLPSRIISPIVPTIIPRFTQDVNEEKATMTYMRPRRNCQQPDVPGEKNDPPRVRHYKSAYTKCEKQYFPHAARQIYFAIAQDGNNDDESQEADDDGRNDFAGVIALISLRMADPLRSNYSTIIVTKPSLGKPELPTDEKLVEKWNIARVTAVDTKLIGDHCCDSATHGEGESVQADEAPHGSYGQQFNPDKCTSEQSTIEKHGKQENFAGQQTTRLYHAQQQKGLFFFEGTMNGHPDSNLLGICRFNVLTRQYKTITIYSPEAEGDVIKAYVEHLHYLSPHLVLKVENGAVAADLTELLSLHTPFYAPPAFLSAKPITTTVEIEQAVERKLIFGDIYTPEQATSLDAKLRDDDTAEFYPHGAKFIDTFDLDTSESKDYTSTITVITKTVKPSLDKYALEHSPQPHPLAERVGVNDHISIFPLTLQQLEPQRTDPIGINTSCDAGLTESTRDERDIESLIAAAEALLRGEHVDILDHYRCDFSCAEIIEHAEAYLCDLEADDGIQGSPYYMIAKDSHTAQVARPNTTDAPVVENDTESTALLPKAQELHGDSFTFGASMSQPETPAANLSQPHPPTARVGVHTRYTENRLQMDSIEKPTASIVRMAITTVDTQGTWQSYNLETGGILLRNDYAPTANAVREGVGVLPNEPASATDAGNTDGKQSRSPDDFTGSASDIYMADRARQHLIVSTDTNIKLIRVKDTADNPAEPGDHYLSDADTDSANTDNVYTHEGCHREFVYTHAAMTKYLDDKPDPRIIDTLRRGPPAVATQANSKTAVHLMTSGRRKSILRTN